MSSLTAAPPTASATGVATNSAPPGNQYQELWDEALRKFEEQNKGADKSRRELIKYFLKDLDDCGTPEAIMAVLDQGLEEATATKANRSAWANLRDNCLLPAVQAISVLIDAFKDVASAAGPGGKFAMIGAKVVFAALGVLLKASKWCDEAYDALRRLFEGLNLSLESLDMRAGASCLGTVSKRVAVLMLVNLLDVLTLAVKLLPIKRRRPWVKFKDAISNYWRNLMQDDGLQKAMQRMNDLTVFEAHAIATETQIETAKVSQDTKTILEHTGALSKLLTELRMKTERGVGIIKSIKVDVDSILDSIDRVDEAHIRAQEREGCLENTRVDVLDALWSWSSNTDAPRIYWLNGMAGTGKSTIARSFSRALEKHSRLGGSFFCSRGDNAVLQNAKLIIPTLSRALSAKDSDYYSALIRTLGPRGVEPRPAVWSLCDQVQNLFHKPFEALAASQRAALISRQLILVIDALDEASDMDIQKLLEALVALPNISALPVKFFLTSRPERHIRSQLQSFADKSVLHLHDIERKVVTKDIQLYIEHRFATMTKKFPDLPPSWPGHDALHTITALADNLFIHAFTTTEYILDESGTPQLRLEEVLDLQDSTATKSTDPLKHLDNIYAVILKSARRISSSREIRLTWRVLTAILTVVDPLSVSAHAALLNIEPPILRSLLKQLHSVLRIPDISDDTRGTISTFHASFRDYIEDLARVSSDLWINTQIGHFDIAVGCARMIHSREVYSDRPYFLFDKHCIQLPVAKAPSHVAYAYANWPHHVVNGIEVDGIQLDVEEILMTDFTTWTKTGRVEDIKAAVEVHRRAVGRTVPSDFSAIMIRPMHSPVTNSEHSRQVEKSHTSIHVLYHAIELAPQDHPDAFDVLSCLGHSALHRFKRSGRSVDLERAIVAHRRAFEFTRDKDPDQLQQLRNLKQLLLARYGHTGELASIMQAVAPHQAILSASEACHYDLTEDFGLLWTQTVSDAIAGMIRNDTRSTFCVHVDAVAHPKLYSLVKGLEGLGSTNPSLWAGLILSSRNTAHLSIAPVAYSDYSFEILDTQIRALGLERLDITRLWQQDSLRSALNSASSFLYYLRVSPTQGGLSRMVSARMLRLLRKPTSGDLTRQVLWEPSGDPIELNLCDVFDPELYCGDGGGRVFGLDIFNKSPVGGFDIFFSIFYFHCSTMSIAPLFDSDHVDLPRLPAGMPQPVPLNHGSDLPHDYYSLVFSPNSSDVGYFRIFLFTRKADLSGIEQHNGQPATSSRPSLNMSELGLWDAITTRVMAGLR